MGGNRNYALDIHGQDCARPGVVHWYVGSTALRRYIKWVKMLITLLNFSGLYARNLLVEPLPGVPDAKVRPITGGG
jgi:hypothetical protein